MKKIVFLITAAFVAISLQAQNVDVSAVPLSVKTKFAKMYPNVKIMQWEKEDANYEANFKEDNTEESATYDATGKFVQSEKTLQVTELPKAITDYLAKNSPGKKIKEASQVTDAAGIITYEVQIKKVDYIFDANGNFVKQETLED
jgi:hypothetical protein